MNKTRTIALLATIALAFVSSCAKIDDVPTLDLSKVYKQISFSATVSDWETAIYENNDDF